MRATILLLFSIALLSAACSKRHVSVSTPCMQTIACTNPALLPYFPAYTYAEVDTIICIQYIAGGNFDSITGTQAYTTYASFKINASDTTTNVTAGIMIAPGCDYEIIVPATADTFAISGITMRASSQTYECDDAKFHTCYNTISEIHVTKNGQPDTHISFVPIGPGFLLKFDR